MPLSDARKRANTKYAKKAYETILLRVKKGQKDEIKAIAEQNGESLNGFILDATMKKIEALTSDNESH